MLTICRYHHTCFKVIHNDKAIMLDPILNLDIEGNGYGPGILDDVSAIFISHAHTDHFDIATLSFLPRNISIYVPKDDDKLPEGMYQVLHELNFSNIHQVTPWMNIEVGTITVTFVPVRSSIEGTVQFAFVIQAEDISFFNGVDCLEEDKLFTEIAKQFKFDVISLPSNSGFMLNAVRNQMSPMTALQTARILKPKIFFPTGSLTSTKANKSYNSVQFPEESEYQIVKYFLKQGIEGCNTLELPFGNQLCISKDNYFICKIAPCDQSENHLYLVTSHLLAGSRRNKYFFNISIYKNYDIWYKKWNKLMYLVKDQELKSILISIPPKYLGIPANQISPRTLSYIYNKSHDFYFSILKQSLYDISGKNKHDLAKNLLRILCQLDNVSKELSNVEYSFFLLSESLILQPNLPNTLCDFKASELYREQIDRDLKDLSIVYPRIAAYFKPISITTSIQVAFNLNTQEWPLKTFVLPTIDRDKGSIIFTQLTTQEQIWVLVIEENYGKFNITELCNKLGWSADSFIDMCTSLLIKVPGLIELHCLPTEDDGCVSLSTDKIIYQP
jgi:L-ascorbate metabolism protein UlaG (beta-lactamase superfamily)